MEFDYNYMPPKVGKGEKVGTLFTGMV